MSALALLELHPEVAAAVRAGRPVVALESTLIAHGLPWPLNVETALEAEEIIRQEGAVPATIAVLKGRPSRPGCRDGPATHRRHDGVRHDVPGLEGRYSALCNGRHRRGPSR